MSTEVSGLEGFFWWFGVVEDRNDPKNLGRIKVRVHNFHGDKIKTPTEDLQWAPIIMQPTSASSSEVGNSPTGILVGTTVFGFFADGKEGQVPMVLGTLHGIPIDHDVTPLARGINNLNKNLLGPEPTSPYGTVYPYNKVFQTESGHVVEFDDTPNKERIHIYHRTGSYQEINEVGRKVEKVVDDNINVYSKDNIQHVQKNKNTKIVGNEILNIDGTRTTLVQGNESFTTNSNRNSKINNNDDLEVGSNKNTKVGGDTRSEIGGSRNVNIRRNLNYKVGGRSTLDLGSARITYTARSPALELNIFGDWYGNVVGNSYLNMTGNMNMNVQGNVSLIVTGEANVSVSGNLIANVLGSSNVNITQSLNANVSGNTSLRVGGSLTGNISGNTMITVGGDLTGNVIGSSMLMVGGSLTANITGNTNINALSSLNANVVSDAIVRIGGNLTANIAGNSNVRVDGNLIANVGGNAQMIVSNNLVVNTGGNFTVNAAGNVYLKGAYVIINNGTEGAVRGTDTITITYGGGTNYTGSISSNSSTVFIG